ncbi:MAG TPA: ATP-binding cassette domain-containing protein [Nitrososphaeraceae archaeon]|nr:ATP-binding cassette domain-containing protein [Nitrososphaeraceae archaeon]
MKNTLPYDIRVNNLVKAYENNSVPAVRGISFEVKEGEFFGFLGPNGAGKSTTIKILTTLMPKSSGSVSIAGVDLDNEPQKIRRVIGVQSQETALDLDLTGHENLMLQGHLQHMSDQTLEKRVNELLSLVTLEDVADRRAAFYSGGMKKRLDLATSLIHNPKILFLDEPTTGLDPQSRAAIWSYLKRLNKEDGITIFLTTQYMEEADRLCDRLSIIDHGQIVAQGTPEEMKREISADAVSLTIANGEDVADSGHAIATAKQVLSRIGGVTEIIDSDNGLTVYGKNGAFLVPEIIRALDNAEVRISSINISSPTLDDVFLKHTGRRIRTEGQQAEGERGTIEMKRRRGFSFRRRQEAA